MQTSKGMIRVRKTKKFFVAYSAFILISLLLVMHHQTKAQFADTVFHKKNINFKSNNITLSGTIYKARYPQAALVIVHGSGQALRMSAFAADLAKNGITVFTYDKRGVGASGGTYAGPEVGTNNIDSVNLNLLAQDASAAVNKLHQMEKNTPIGLVGFSQAGWIIPIAASKNPMIKFMVLFSCPTINTLEQLRFQFYTNGNNSFWDHHTEAEAREHIQHDADRYQFIATDPIKPLNKLTIPGLWIYGEKDIQIPVKLCMEKLNQLKVQGKPYEYALFTDLGHNTAFDGNTDPVSISVQWIKQKVFGMKKTKASK